MTSVSAGHIILTPTQPLESGRPQGELKPGPPHQESCVLPTELPRPRERAGSVRTVTGLAIMVPKFKDCQIQTMLFTFDSR